MSGERSKRNDSILQELVRMLEKERLKSLDVFAKASLVIIITIIHRLSKSFILMSFKSIK